MEANQTTQTPADGNVSPSNSGGNGNGDLFSQQQQGQPPAAAAPVKPEGLDDRFFDAKEGVKFGDLVKEFGALSQFKSEAEAKAAEAEAAKITDPNGYKLEFADGMLPEGFQIDPDSPLWNVARETAIANGWSQDTFAKASAAMIGILAGQETQMAAEMQKVAAAEAQKLGPNAAAMSDAVTQWINANAPEEAAKVLGASGVLVNAGVIRFLTQNIQALNNAGVTSLVNLNREVTKGPNEAEWNSMSFAQRMKATMPNFGARH